MNTPDDYSYLNSPTEPPVLSGYGPPEGVRCVQHPHLQAVQQCQLCGAFSCATCDFMLANGLHICPTCASGSKTGLGSSARKFVIASYVTAVWSTVCIACLMSGMFASMVQTEEDAMVVGFMVIIFAIVPAIIGFSMAFGARRPKRPSPTSLWIALVWNGVLILGYMGLMLLGVLRRNM